MAPADDGSDAAQAAFVSCPDCGSRASAAWTFCRRCQAPLDDAEPADETLVVGNDGENVDLSEVIDEETGCAKCGHTEADVEDIATTSDGIARLLDIQDRRFTAVSCRRCGYTEFYKGRRPGVVLDLFVG